MSIPPPQDVDLTTAIITPTLRRRVLDLAWRAYTRMESTRTGLQLESPEMDPCRSTVFTELAFNRVVARAHQVEASWDATAAEVRALMHQLVGTFPLENGDESAAFGELLQNTRLAGGGASAGIARLSTPSVSLNSSSHAGGSRGGLEPPRALQALPNATAAALVEQRFRDLEREHAEQATELSYCQAKLKRREVVLDYVQSTFQREVQALQDQLSALAGGKKTSAVGTSVAQSTFSLLDWLELLELHFDPRSGKPGAKADLLLEQRRRQRRSDVASLVEAGQVNATAAAALKKFEAMHELREFHEAAASREEGISDALSKLQRELDIREETVKAMSTRHTSEAARYRNQVARLEANVQHLKNDVLYASTRIKELESELEQKSTEAERLRSVLEQQAAQANLSELVGLAHDTEMRNTSTNEAAKLALERKRIYGLLDKVMSGGSVTKDDILAGMNEDDPATAAFLRGAEEMKQRESAFDTMQEQMDQLRDDFEERSKRVDELERCVQASVGYFHNQGMRVPRSLREYYPQDADDGFDATIEVDWAEEAKVLEKELNELKANNRRLIYSIEQSKQVLEQLKPEEDLVGSGTWSDSDDSVNGHPRSPPQQHLDGGTLRGGLLAVTPGAGLTSRQRTSHADGLTPRRPEWEIAADSLSEAVRIVRQRVDIESSALSRFKSSNLRLKRVNAETRDAQRHLQEQLQASKTELTQIAALRDQAAQAAAMAEQTVQELGAENDSLIAQLKAIKRAGEDMPAMHQPPPPPPPPPTDVDTSQPGPIQGGKKLRTKVNLDGTAVTPNDESADLPSPHVEMITVAVQTVTEATTRKAPEEVVEASVQTEILEADTDSEEDAPVSAHHRKGAGRKHVKTDVAAAATAPSKADPSGRRGATTAGGRDRLATSTKGGDKSPAVSPRKTIAGGGGGVSPAQAASRTGRRPSLLVPPKLLHAKADESDEEPEEAKLPPTAVSDDLIDKLWAAITTNANTAAQQTNNGKPGHPQQQSTQGGTSPAQSPWRSARTVCTSCGGSIAVSAAGVSTVRVATTNTDDDGMSEPPSSSSKRNRGAVAGVSGRGRGASTAWRPTARGAETAKRAAAASEAHDSETGSAQAAAMPKCMPQRNQGVQCVLLNDDDGTPVASCFDEVGGISEIDSVSFVQRSRRRKEVAVQTVGWLDSEDYAVALAMPDKAVRLSKHTLRYHRKHYQKLLGTGANNERYQIAPGAIDLRPESASGSSASDSNLDAGIAALQELQRVHVPAAVTDPTTGGGARHFVAGVWGAQGLKRHRQVPPSVAGESSAALEDYASALSSVHPISWEADHHRRMKLNANSSGGGALAVRPETSGIDRNAPLLPHFAGRLRTPTAGAQRGGGAGGTASAARSRATPESPALPPRASTPGPTPSIRAGVKPSTAGNVALLRPQSVGLGGKSCSVPPRGPSASAIAAAKQMLLGGTAPKQSSGLDPE
jgi:hypothetical protein